MPDSIRATFGGIGVSLAAAMMVALPPIGMLSGPEIAAQIDDAPQRPDRRQAHWRNLSSAV